MLRLPVLVSKTVSMIKRLDPVDQPPAHSNVGVRPSPFLPRDYVPACYKVMDFAALELAV